jgi:hypothetical protein
VPASFLEKFGQKITGILSGFDRMRFRGVLRLLMKPGGMNYYLQQSKVLLKDFGRHAEQLTARLKRAASERAQSAQRPEIFVRDCALSKEDLARQIARRDQLESGLIVVLRALECCQSFRVRGNGQTKRLEAVLEPRKCSHFYYYYMHPDFGRMHVRLQSWFPFRVDVCLNGREWLARQMDRVGLGYRQIDNCFVHLEDWVAAQGLMDEQLCTPWAAVLEGLLEPIHPLVPMLRATLGQGYYWSASATEYATDLLFEDPRALSRLYPQFLRHGLSTFDSEDVLRFLGKRRPELFTGELKGRLAHRPEGVRLRHTVNGNSRKIYDKEGQVLRVETTINRPREFQVFRPRQDDRAHGHRWQPLRWGVADVHRRAEVSQAANRRYLEALSSVSGKTSLGQEAAGVCRRLILKGRRYRALNPWTLQDSQLLEAISRGEFALNGLRNADLRQLLYPPTKDRALQRRQAAAAVSRKLALLRAHGLLRKVNNTHRYLVTKSGRRILTALLAARNADLDTLNQLAA